MATDKQKQKIVEAFLARLATGSFQDVALADVAADAAVTLPQLREAFDGRLAIYAEYLRRVDREVLAGVDAALADEPPRERLLDVLMRRFDVIAPQKGAVRAMRDSTRRDPLLALAVAGLLATSMRWMLVAGGVDRAGPKGAVRAHGLLAVWTRALDVWLDDEDPGLAATMVAVDKGLRRGDQLMGMAGGMMSFAERLACRGRRREKPVAAEGTVGEGI